MNVCLLFYIFGKLRPARSFKPKCSRKMMPVLNNRKDSGAGLPFNLRGQQLSLT